MVVRCCQYDQSGLRGDQTEAAALFEVSLPIPDELKIVVSSVPLVFFTLRLVRRNLAASCSGGMG